MTLPTWADMDRAPRHAASRLTADQVPKEPGVYAWYRGGTRVYVGKANSLRTRLWGNHLMTSPAPTGSAFRRNVAASLGFGAPAQLKRRTITLTDDQLQQLRDWILGCEVAWLTCSTGADSLALETALKREFKPPLTRR